MFRPTAALPRIVSHSADGVGALRRDRGGPAGSWQTRRPLRERSNIEGTGPSLREMIVSMRRRSSPPHPTIGTCETAPVANPNERRHDFLSLRIIPYLVMDGNAAEAIRFYERVLGAKVLFRQSGSGEEVVPERSLAPALDSVPDGPRPPESEPKVSHATLQIGESTVMIRDATNEQPYRSGNNITIAISTFNVDEARRMFAELQEGGHVHAPLRATPFSPAHGLVTDKFGVPFQITAQPSE